MPITVILPAPGPIGPGFLFQLQSTAQPAPGISWIWTIDIEQKTPTGEGFALWSSTQPYSTAVIQDVLLNGNAFAGGGFAADLPVRITIRIQTPDHIDQETLTIPTGYSWDGTTNLPQQIHQEAQDVSLSAEQADQLGRTDFSVSLNQVTDALGLLELTHGPSGGPVDEAIVLPTFGVLVRLSSLPPDLVPSTPDEDYFVKTLATVRLYRGQDLWIRAPIHTTSKIVPFQNEGLTVWVPGATVGTWILNIHLSVRFLAGVTGQVFLMRFPV